MTNSFQSVQSTVVCDHYRSQNTEINTFALARIKPLDFLRLFSAFENSPNSMNVLYGSRILLSRNQLHSTEISRDQILHEYKTQTEGRR